MLKFFFIRGLTKSKKTNKSLDPCCLIVVQTKKHCLDVDTSPVAFMLCWRETKPYQSVPVVALVRIKSSKPPSQWSAWHRRLAAQG
jgi:hypothetical protein